MTIDSAYISLIVFELTQRLDDRLRMEIEDERTRRINVELERNKLELERIELLRKVETLEKQYMTLEKQHIKDVRTANLLQKKYSELAKKTEKKFERSAEYSSDPTTAVTKTTKNPS